MSDTTGTSHLVLLVDDDIYTQQLFQAALKRSAMSLVCASSYTAALEILGTLSPSLIVLDIMLPEGHDGYQLLRLVRNRYSLTCPVIATSAYYDHDANTRVQQDGFSGFLPKPLPIEQLTDVLQNAIRKG